MGKYSDAGCNGIGESRGQSDFCGARRWPTCLCKSECGIEHEHYDHKECQGKLSLNFELGIYEGGQYDGCFCKSTCGTQIEACDVSGCKGYSNAGG